MKNISRRQFIKIFLLTFTAIIAGTLVIFDFNKVVIEMLKQDLSHLKTDPAGFEKFVEEAEESKHWAAKFFDWKKKQFVRFGYIADNLLPSFPYKYKYLQYRSDIVGDFLLSTDFFINKMDATQPVSYIGIYNPYLRPCSNPFSNLYYPQV